jgi:hypothetical protein
VAVEAFNAYWQLRRSAILEHKHGVAVFPFLSGCRGSWYFQLSNDAAAQRMHLSPGRVLMLPLSATLLFLPEPDAVGVAELTLLGWDGVGGRLGDTVDVQGLSSASLSREAVTVSVEVIAVNDSPQLEQTEAQLPAIPWEYTETSSHGIAMRVGVPATAVDPSVVEKELSTFFEARVRLLRALAAPPG